MNELINQIQSCEDEIDILKDLINDSENLQDNMAKAFYDLADKNIDGLLGTANEAVEQIFAAMSEPIRGDIRLIKELAEQLIKFYDDYQGKVDE